PLPEGQRRRSKLMDRLRQKVAMITGGANGIGHGCALRYASEGAALAVIDLEQTPLDDLRHEVEAAGGTIFTRAGDCTDAETVRGFVADATREFGPIDILLNNVGQGAREGKTRFLESDEDV